MATCYLLRKYEMRISEVVGLQTPRQYNRTGKPLLRTTALHYDQASGNKVQVIVLMPPSDFLKLAAKVGSMGDFRQKSQKLLAYNRYAKSEENIHMPFLRIGVPDMYKGQVKSHEGRHRAAAVMNAKGDWIRVALELRPEQDYEPQLAQQDMAKHGRLRNNLEYYMTAADLPQRVYNQFNSIFYVETSGWRVEEPDFLGRYRR